MFALYSYILSPDIYSIYIILSLKYANKKVIKTLFINISPIIEN